MVGTLVNVGTIVGGSLIGGLARRAMNEELSNGLMTAMGFAAFGLGLNAVVQNMPKSNYPVLFIVSLALGCLIGTLLQLDRRIAALTQRKGEGGDSLEQIADFLQNRDAEKMTQMLRAQKQIAHQKYQEWMRIEKKIGHRLDRLDEAKAPGLEEVVCQTLPKCRMIRIQSDLSLHSYLDLEGAIRELEREQESATVFLGKVGVGIARERLERGDFIHYDTAFLMLDPEDTVRGEFETLPETQCVSLRFPGSHPEAPAFYEKLLKFIRKNHLSVAGFSREITLIDDGLTRHTEEFVTEIQIPVQEDRT